MIQVANIMRLLHLTLNNIRVLPMLYLVLSISLLDIILNLKTAMTTLHFYRIFAISLKPFPQ